MIVSEMVHYTRGHSQGPWIAHEKFEARQNRLSSKIKLIWNKKRLITLSEL